MRIAGSSQASPYACVAAGIASLWGPAHGGANEAVIVMLEAIGAPRPPIFLCPLRVPSFCWRALSRRCGRSQWHSAVIACHTPTIRLLWP